ncbi:MAG TPA: alkaline phosphatase family protein [Solirubrobacteraceae bacterium]|nr:alkaline phosphatase family protein [Solirubrobacteraceae bacterium]
MTPIKHVVVLFGENVSFDHYFGTYPYAENKPGEPPFHALPNTPNVNGLSNTLLTANPNADEPQRLSPDQALTCDQNHAYTPEQSAYDGGLTDQFVQDTTGNGCKQSTSPDSGSYGPSGIVMDYYDGNTVTALWNLAQHYTLSDNSYDTQFGPSTPGALNVISGNTHGATAEGGSSTSVTNGTMNGDIDPYYDECSNSSATPSGPGEAGGVTGALTGTNIGDLLNGKSLTWGWFQGGFTPSSYNGSQPVCATAHNNVGGASVADYSPHHEPFQYYQSTSNPLHLSPANVAQVGTGAPSGVNHQYDLTWFNDALKVGDMPAVSYLKAPEYQDGHAGYSDPLDEQRFIVDEINRIEQSPDWASTAIFIAYDDSDGWYDHQMGPIIRGSQDAADTLNGPGRCGSTTISDPGTADRCGVGPRTPLLVISPWAKQNYVDNSFTEQASIPKFIEDNWSLGRIGSESADAAAGSLMNAFDFDQRYGHAPAIIMNPDTGEITRTIPAKASGGQSTARAPSPGGSGSPSSSGATKRTVHHVTIKLPKVSYEAKAGTRKLTIAFRTTGGTRVRTQLRLRVNHRGHLVANHAVTVRNHRATFNVALGQRRSGSYRMVLSIDAGGTLGVMRRTIRVR